jgi:stage II sporulation protein M
MRVLEIIRQRELIRNLVVATGIFFVSLALGILLGRTVAEDLIGELGGTLGSFAPAGGISIVLLVIIFVNNALKTLGLIFLGILLGVPTALLIGINGFIIGGFASALAAANGWTYVVASLLPHGVIEIPVVLLAAALGLTLGTESFKWLQHRENSVRPVMSDCLKVYTRLILPGLAVAAIVETFVTPLLIGLVGTG